jgi:hypothetical protein
LDRPLISPADDLADETAVAVWGDDQPAACIRGIGLGMTPGTERHQPVEIEVRAPLGALDDVVDRIGVAIRTSFDLDGASVEIRA